MSSITNIDWKSLNEMSLDCTREDGVRGAEFYVAGVLSAQDLQGISEFQTVAEEYRDEETGEINYDALMVDTNCYARLFEDNSVELYVSADGKGFDYCPLTEEDKDALRLALKTALLHEMTESFEMNEAEIDMNNLPECFDKIDAYIDPEEAVTKTAAEQER